jgi:Uma2 family endonuclease
MSGKDAMKPAAPGVKLTYDDFLLFPDDGQRHELIDGEHYVTPSPVPRHQRIASNFHWWIRSYLEERPIGVVFFAPVDIVLSHFDIVVPDLVYMSNERSREVMTDANVRGAPDLVIEIGSPGTSKRDETIKLRLYERTGVLEYWIVDPQRDVVRVYRRAQDSFAPPIQLSLEAGDVLTTSLLPGLELPLRAVFNDHQAIT